MKQDFYLNWHFNFTTNIFCDFAIILQGLNQNNEHELFHLFQWVKFWSLMSGRKVCCISFFFSRRSKRRRINWKTIWYLIAWRNATERNTIYKLQAKERKTKVLCERWNCTWNICVVSQSPRPQLVQEDNRMALDLVSGKEQKRWSSSTVSDEGVARDRQHRQEQWGEYMFFMEKTSK